MKLIGLSPQRGAFEVVGLNEIAAGDRFDLEHVCRQQVQPVFLGDNAAICRVLGRYKFFVDTRDHGLGCHLLLDGFWEMWLTMIMARAIKPGMTVIDVGANCGYYAVLMADLVGPTGRLVAVEPNPAACAMMRRSLAMSGLTARTTLVEAAAADRNEGSALLYVPSHEPKNATIVADDAQIDPATGVLASVPLWSVDASRESIGRVDLIKIDAEGAEPAILRGMRKTIARDTPNLVLEYNAARYDDPVAMVDELLSIYGALYAVTFHGTLRPVSKAEILGRRDGEDWLLYCSTDVSSAMPPPRNRKLRSLR